MNTSDIRLAQWVENALCKATESPCKQQASMHKGNVIYTSANGRQFTVDKRGKVRYLYNSKAIAPSKLGLHSNQYFF